MERVSKAAYPTPVCGVLLAGLFVSLHFGYQGHWRPSLPLVAVEVCNDIPGGGQRRRPSAAFQETGRVRCDDRRVISRADNGQLGVRRSRGALVRCDLTLAVTNVTSKPGPKSSQGSSQSLIAPRPGIYRLNCPL